MRRGQQHLPTNVINVFCVQRKQTATRYWDYCFENQFKPFYHFLVAHLETICGCPFANSFKSSFKVSQTWVPLPNTQHHKLSSRRAPQPKITYQPTKPTSPGTVVAPRLWAQTSFLPPLVWERAWDAASFMPCGGNFVSLDEQLSCLVSFCFNEVAEDAPPFMICLGRLVQTADNVQAYQVKSNCSAHKHTSPHVRFKVHIVITVSFIDGDSAEGWMEHASSATLHMGASRSSISEWGALPENASMGWGYEPAR